MERPSARTTKGKNDTRRGIKQKSQARRARGKEQGGKELSKQVSPDKEGTTRAAGEERPKKEVIREGGDQGRCKQENKGSGRQSPQRSEQEEYSRGKNSKAKSDGIHE